jgi:DNA-binding beta-propeller fold protein YncE
MFPVPGNPFGVAATQDGRWAFVAAGGSIEVLRITGLLTLVRVRSIPVPGAPLGETITRDGRYLLIADGDGAVVISVARAERASAGAVLGTLAAPGGARGPGGGSAIEAAVSPDGRFAFVTLEYAQRAAVFNLAKALASGFGPADYVGSIPLGQAAVGMAVSPDGRWLYATSEIGLPPSRIAQTAAVAIGRGAPAEPPGTLTVISLRRAETDPAASVVATVDAGCEPVRVITSADGTEVWVTARASDDLLCFSAARLASEPARALVAIARVGEAPVGLAAVRGGSLVVVADSNRFGASGASSDLDVVNVASAFSGHPAVIGHIRSGVFPRDMALAPDGTLLVSNYSSDQIEAVDVASIPGG